MRPAELGVEGRTNALLLANTLHLLRAPEPLEGCFGDLGGCRVLAVTPERIPFDLIVIDGYPGQLKRFRI